MRFQSRIYNKQLPDISTFHNSLMQSKYNINFHLSLLFWTELSFHMFLQNNVTVNLSIFTIDYIPCNGHGLDSEWTLDRGDVGHAQQMVSS